VIDFSVLKEKIGGWIDEYWDHTMILFDKDADAIKACKSVDSNKPIFILSSNPTAENMADYLLREVCPDVLRGTGVEVIKVILWETENCYASVSKN